MTTYDALFTNFLTYITVVFDAPGVCGKSPGYVDISGAARHRRVRTPASGGCGSGRSS